MPAQQKNELDIEIAARFLMTEEYRKADTILIYISKKDEINTFPILYAAFANGKKVAAPKCIDNKHMIFYQISSPNDLESGYYGLMEPKRGLKEIKDYEGTLCLTPCFCLDMEGHRVGHGAGYYDLFLNKIFTGTKVALAYSRSVLKKIDYDRYDNPVDVIVTDSYTRHIIDKE